MKDLIPSVDDEENGNLEVDFFSILPKIYFLILQRVETIYGAYQVSKITLFRKELITNRLNLYNLKRRKKKLWEIVKVL